MILKGYSDGLLYFPANNDRKKEDSMRTDNENMKEFADMIGVKRERLTRPLK